MMVETPRTIDGVKRILSVYGYFTPAIKGSGQRDEPPDPPRFDISKIEDESGIEVFMSQYEEIDLANEIAEKLQEEL